MHVKTHGQPLAFQGCRYEAQKRDSYRQQQVNMLQGFGLSLEQATARIIAMEKRARIG